MVVHGIGLQSYGCPETREVLPQMAADFSGIRTVLPPVNEPIAPTRPVRPSASRQGAAGVDGRRARSTSRSSSAARRSAPATLGHAVMPHEHAPRAGRLPQGAGRARAAGHRRRARPRGASGRAGRWEDRAAVFLKAADLLATTWRATLNAATMLGQSKTASRPRSTRPASSSTSGASTSPSRSELLRRAADLDARRCGTRSTTAPLEGFVYAVTPFNFTAIGGNLPTAPALMGNTVVWKPAATAMLSAYYTDAAARGGRPAAGRHQLRARRPGDDQRDRCSSSPTWPASTSPAAPRCSSGMWKTRRRATSSNYRSLPAPRRRDRRQGLHRRAPVGRSAGGGGGASCAAASSTRARSARRPAASTCRSRSGPTVRDRAVAMMREITMGDVARLPQLHGRGDRQEGVRRRSAATSTTPSSNAKILQGGGCRRRARATSSSRRWSRPTTPATGCCARRSSGRCVTAYVYPDAQVGTRRSTIGRPDVALRADRRGLRARPRRRSARPSAALRNAAGNFYINDKPTGAVVGQQPFGGARGVGHQRQGRARR